PRAVPLCDLHSFPTRRSSDLVPDEDPASLRPGGTERLPGGPQVQSLGGQGPAHGARMEPADVALQFRRLGDQPLRVDEIEAQRRDRKSTRLNSSHVEISYAVF